MTSHLLSPALFFFLLQILSLTHIFYSEIIKYKENFLRSLYEIQDQLQS